MENKIKDAIKKIANKAKKAQSATGSQQYAQSVLNLVNALVILESRDK